MKNLQTITFSLNYVNQARMVKTMFKFAERGILAIVDTKQHLKKKKKVLADIFLFFSKLVCGIPTGCRAIN